MFDFARLLVFQLSFEPFQPFPDALLDFGDVPVRNHFPGGDNRFTGGVEDHGFGRGSAILFLELGFQALTFLDDRFEAGGNLLIIRTFDLDLALVELINLLVTLDFDFGDFGVDHRGLFTLRNGDFIFEALESLLAGIFVNIGNDVLRKIQNAIEVAARNIKQQAQVRGNAPGIPNMRDRGRQGNMPHPLAADGSAGHFNAALIAGDAFVAGILVLTAITLPIAGRAKNRLTKQAIFFRPQAAVVDGFRFEDLAIRP